MIYILGGNGFVGSGFSRLFAKMNLEYKIITRDNYAALAGSSCDVFINANGNSSKVLAKREPITDFDANVRVTRAVLEDFHYEFYIHLSSCDVYEDCSCPDATREDRTIDMRRQSPYGFHKFLAEHCVRHRCDRWLILRQGGFVGPGLKKNAIFDILNGPKIWLDPQSELQFLHTDDSAAIIWSLYTKRIVNEIINVCGRGLVKLQDVIRQCGKDIKPEKGSPCVHYEVSIDKLVRYAKIPETSVTVFNFMEQNNKIYE